MRHVRMATIAASLGLLGVWVAGAHGGVAPTVACDRIVLRERTGAVEGSRVLLDAVSLPSSRHLSARTDEVPGRSWPYYRNAGLAIRAGTSAVSVSVPEGWRDRVAISWGGSPAASRIGFAPCRGSARGSWNAYSGGFHLRLRGDCVPLDVRVGGVSTTVRVGVGRACGASSANRA